MCNPAPATPSGRDSDELPFLELAFAAVADTLISGDADLLTLAPIDGLPLHTSAQAIAHLSQPRPQQRTRESQWNPASPSS